MLEKLWQQQRQKIVESAQPYLQPGETVKFVFIAQTVLPSWLAPLPWAGLYGSRKRAVIIGDQNAYILRMSIWKPTDVFGVIEKYPLASANFSHGTLGSIKIGNTRLWHYGGKEAVAAVDFLSKSASQG